MPRFSNETIVDLPPPTGPISRRIRLRISSRFAAELKYSTNCSRGFSTPKMSLSKK